MLFSLKNSLNHGNMKHLLKIIVIHLSKKPTAVEDVLSKRLDVSNATATALTLVTDAIMAVADATSTTAGHMSQ